MSEPFIGEIKIVGFNFAPRGWAFCRGQIMPIQQNAALFALLSTTYGGNGHTDFGLPDLQGRVPVGFGNSSTTPQQYVLGEIGGAASVTPTLANLPAHTHAITGTQTVQAGPAVLDVEADLVEPVNGSFLALANDGNGNNMNLFHAPNTSSSQIQLASNSVPVNGNLTVGVSGQSQSLSVMNPYLAVNYIIALTGTYPSRN